MPHCSNENTYCHSINQCSQRWGKLGPAASVDKADVIGRIHVLWGKKGNEESLAATNIALRQNSLWTDFV